MPQCLLWSAKAGDRDRTGNIQLGRLTLYQLSYTRKSEEIVPSRAAKVQLKPEFC